MSPAAARWRRRKGEEGGVEGVGPKRVTQEALEMTLAWRSWTKRRRRSSSSSSMSSKRSKEVGSVSVAEVELLHPYWWLLSPAQRAKEQEFLAAAVKKANDAGRTSGAASSSGAKDKAPTVRPSGVSPRARQRRRVRLRSGQRS